MTIAQSDNPIAVKITAVIKPFRLEAVRDALYNIGVRGMSVRAVLGFGRQRGHAELYRGREYLVDLVPKVCIEVVVVGSERATVIEAISRSARTGRIGDGKIWIEHVLHCSRVRTGERGVNAI